MTDRRFAKMRLDWFRDKRAIALRPSAAIAYWRATLYCAADLTNGELPLAAMREWTSKRDLDQLAEVGFLSVSGETVTLTDYKQEQTTREQVDKKRDRQSEGGRKGAKRRWSDGSTHGLTHASTEGAGDGSTNGVRIAELQNLEIETPPAPHRDPRVDVMLGEMSLGADRRLLKASRELHDACRDALESGVPPGRLRSFVGEYDTTGSRDKCKVLAAAVRREFRLKPRAA